MPTLIAYTDNSGQPLAAAVIDCTTAKVWDWQAKAWVTSGGTAELLPLQRLSGPNLSGLLVGWAGTLPPAPAGVEQWIVTVHPATGGPPVGPPFTVSPSPPPQAIRYTTVSGQ